MKINNVKQELCHMFYDIEKKELAIIQDELLATLAPHFEKFNRDPEAIQELNELRSNIQNAKFKKTVKQLVEDTQLNRISKVHRENNLKKNKK